ncbi:MAG: response regulator [Planctomycetota bacterium]
MQVPFSMSSLALVSIAAPSPPAHFGGLVAAGSVPVVASAGAPTRSDDLELGLVIALLAGLAGLAGLWGRRRVAQRAADRTRAGAPALRTPSLHSGGASRGAVALEGLERAPSLVGAACDSEVSAADQSVRQDALGDGAVPVDRGRLVGARILLADDTPSNRRLMALVLERAGAVVETAEHGADAVARWSAAEAAGRGFELVLMDAQMPVMDGAEAAAELRRLGATRAIVALTADARPDAQRHYLQLGFDALASKPIDRDDLLDAAARWLPALAV